MEKLPPDSEPIVASGVPELVAMSMPVGLLEARVPPLTVDPLKFTVPKSASGRTPGCDDDASVMISAEERESQPGG